MVVRRILATVASTALASCGSPALDRDAAADAPSPDARIGPHVTGRLVDLLTDNSAAGLPETTVRANPFDVKLAVALDGGAPTDLAIADDGLFAFARAADDQPYRVTFTRDGITSVSYESSAPRLDIATVTIGPEDRAPLTQPTPVHFKLTNFEADASDFILLETTGLRSEVQVVPDGGSGSSFTLPDFHAASPTALDPAAHDRAVITNWSSITSASGGAYAAITSIATPGPFTMVDGRTTELGTLELGAPAATCLHIIAPRATEASRIQTAIPRTYTSTAATWRVLSAAGPGVGALGDLEMAVQPQTAPTDFAQDVTVRDPFGDTSVIVSMTVTKALTRNTAMQTESFRQVTLPLTGACPTVSVAPEVAIPSVATIGGVDVSQLGAHVPLGTAPLAVAWSRAAPGMVDEVALLLVEVDGSDNLHAIEARILPPSAVTTTFAPQLFQVGHRYALQLSNRRGFPGAAHGDYASITFPLEASSSFTAAFTMVSP